RRPRVLDQIGSLANEQYLPLDDPIVHEVFGLRTDMKAKIFEWRQDAFAFPLRLVQSEHADRTLGEAIEYADHAAAAMLRGLRELFPERRFNAQDPLPYCTLRSYWQGLEAAFRPQIGDERVTGDQATRESWLQDWREIVRRAARKEMD